MAINTVTLVGRLVREPANRHTQQGTSVTSFTLAVDNGKGREAAFIDCVAWKGTADFVSGFMHKGTKVAVSGRLSTRSWEDNSGNKRKSTEVVVYEIEFAESKRENAGVEHATYPSGQYQRPTPGAFEEIEDDSDLPF